MNESLISITALKNDLKNFKKELNINNPKNKSFLKKKIKISKIKNELENSLEKQFKKYNKSKKKLIKKKNLEIINKSKYKKTINEIKVNKNNNNNKIFNSKITNNENRNKSFLNKNKMNKSKIKINKNEKNFKNNSLININPLKINVKKSITKDIKNKKEKNFTKKLEEKYSFKPRINEFSRSIIKLKENLKNEEDNLKDNRNQIFKIDDKLKIDDSKKFTFTPKINKKSKILANALNDSSKRYENLYKKSFDIQNKKKMMKEQKELEVLKKENEILMKKRKIKNSYFINNTSISGENGIHDRNLYWKEKNKDKIEKIKKEKLKNISKICTFKPKINKFNPKIFENKINIVKNNSINSYIKKKYKHLNYERKNEESDKENLNNSDVDLFYENSNEKNSSFKKESGINYKNLINNLKNINKLI